jgi:hypothetical protein
MPVGAARSEWNRASTQERRRTLFGMFKVLEHAADLGFRAHAGSFPELFERVAEALVAIAMEARDIEPRLRPCPSCGRSDRSLTVPQFRLCSKPIELWRSYGTAPLLPKLV